MSELDLVALAEAAKAKSSLTPLKEINAALQACTFGRFHIKLLFVAFFGIMAGTFINTSTGYLLPIAECDLHMNLLHKGLLNAMPFIGMLLSSMIGGFLTDAFGRKIFLVSSFAGIFLCTLMAASSQTYEMLITMKFFEGLLFAACFSAMVSLTSEFCYNEIRDRVVLFQSSFVAVAQICIGLISWGMLSNDWKVVLFDGKFVLNTWNFYLYAVSLWSLAACILYAVLLPESPKYLVTQKKYDEARNILIRVYVENTGKPAGTYPFIDIWKDKTKHALDEAPEKQATNSFRHHIVVGLHNIKPMFEKPLVIYLTLICTINFVSMAVFHVFRLWYPQLSAIIENYQAEGPKDLCIMLDAYTGAERIKRISNITEDAICVPTKSGSETYINSIIIGCVCIGPYLITGIVVNKVGKKTLLILTGTIVTAFTISLKFANSKVAIVSLFSVTVAVAQIMLSLNQAFTVEVFGTTTRSLALSFMMFCGRLGTLTGNICFPILLNVGCAELFFTVAGLIACYIVMKFVLQRDAEHRSFHSSLSDFKFVGWSYSVTALATFIPTKKDSQ